MTDFYKMKKLFIAANDRFLSKDRKLIMDGVSERALCAALKSHLERELEGSEYSMYYADVEYNRNCGKVKTIINENLQIIKIQCDLIVHSRGENENRDNLIALEMKKEYQSDDEKDKDRARLRALTKSKSSDDVWSYDGKTFPQHVCGYVLGIYYEVCSDRINIEYYSLGNLLDREVVWLNRIK